MSLFWSGDSASQDGVGDWAVGDLQIFFFSSKPFSASGLEKREKRFTLDIQGRGVVEGKMMRNPCFLESGTMFKPHNRLKSTWTAVPFPDLHREALQPAPPGQELRVPPAPQVNIRLCSSRAGAGGPRTAQLCPASCVLKRQITWRLGGPLHTRAQHTRSLGASCESSCWEPPPLCLHFTYVTYHLLL